MNKSELIEQIAKRIFVATKAKGVVRIDFLIDSVSGEVFANEINTIPGSFAFYLWQEADMYVPNVEKMNQS